MASLPASKKRQKYNLMLLKNEPHALERVQNADSVAALAASAGLPARTLADSRTLKLSAPRGFRLARLYHWLPGDTIPWEAYTRKHLRELGKTFAQLHQALGKPQTISEELSEGGSPRTRCVRPVATGSDDIVSEEVVWGLPDALDELLDQNAAMQAYFERPGVQKALAQKLGLKTRQNHAKIAQFLSSPKLRNLPTQPLHLDFVRGNVLWDGPAITGIIDFEKTALGPTLVDLARTYAFLIVDCPKPIADIQRYFLHSGYFKFLRKINQPIPKTVAEGGNPSVRCDSPMPMGGIDTVSEELDGLFFANSFQKLVNFFLIYDFYKFLSHNPYESLPKNYHFCRTHDILEGRNILEVL